MSRLLSRILLAMLMLPLAALVYTVAFVVMITQWSWPRPETAIFVVCGAITWALVATYWFFLWRGVVRWTPERIVNSLLAAAGAAVAGVGAAGVVAMLLGGRENGFPAFVGSASAPLLWLVATALIWRETAVERAARVHTAGGGGVVCPACGYNLTGLKSTRCPECGADYTLDELIAAQPSRAMTEVES